MDDLLDTNGISTEGTYQLQDELSNYEFQKQQERAQRKIQWKEWSEQKLDDDVLDTFTQEHRLDTNPALLNELSGRVVRRVVRELININSDQRDTTLYPLPNDYQVTLPYSLRNVKSIRLVSSEIPNTIWNVTGNNNVLLIDLFDTTTGAEFPLVHTSYPYLVIQIPPGHYASATDLLTTMEDTINSVAQTQTGYSNLFTINFTADQDAITFQINQSFLTFHLTFLVSDQTPVELSLYRILGFSSASNVDNTGQPVYASTLTNLVSSSNPIGYGLTLQQPAQPINLTPIRYIYLSLVEHPTLTDLTGTPDFLAKIRLEHSSGSIEYDTYVENPVNFQSPQVSLSTLHFRWYNPFSQFQLVDFGQTNHSFTLEVIRFTTNLAENLYSSQTGMVDESTYSQDTLRVIH